MKSKKNTIHILSTEDFDRKDVHEYSCQEGQNQQIIVILRKSCNATVVANVDSDDSKIDIVGIILGDEAEKIQLHTVQHHKARNTESNLLVKSVMRSSSSFYYDGSIIVDKNAQKTNAYQRNENLLLSTNASARSKPTLEIQADDVRCTHGATVGTLDESQMLYLATRGIRPQTAEKLIVEGFVHSALSGIVDSSKVEKVKKQLWM